jgi:hypothetical protein
VPETHDDTTPEAERSEEIRRGLLAARYQFDPCCQRAFGLAYEAWRRSRRSGPDEGEVAGAGDDDRAHEDEGSRAASGLPEEPTARVIAEALDHGPVAPALVDLVLDIEVGGGSDPLDRFATAIIDEAPAPRPGALFLRAMNAEADGRVLDAEADLAAALIDGPTYAPAIHELARFASERGDINRALALYRRAGPATEAEVTFLTDLLPDHSDVGRNDPCPCGSGRKFKQCHRDNPEVPADRAAIWLFQKVLGYLQRPQFASITTSLASAAADGAMSTVDPSERDDDGPNAWDVRHDAEMRRFRAEPFLMDLALFEGGVIDRFVVERSPLLPAGEIEVLRAWIATDRRLWEVTDVEPGRSLGLRDTATGNRAHVAERAASESLDVGDRVVARVVPAHGELQLIGQPVSISLRHRGSAVQLADRAADAEEWAEWFGGMLAPEPS